MRATTNMLGRASPLRRSFPRTYNLTSRRWNSSGSPGAQPSGQKPVSPHIGFYKTFARPIAKVLLMATFTYQLAYWGWVRLEKDETRAQKNEIAVLERELEDLTK